MSNFYHSYYQGDHSVKANHNINKYYAEKGKYSVSKGSVEFHKKIITFMQEHGLETSNFERYRNQCELRSRINGMFTIIKKSGLEEEFNNYKRQEAEVQA